MEEEPTQSAPLLVPPPLSSDAIEGPSDSSSSFVHEEAEGSSPLHQVHDHQRLHSHINRYWPSASMTLMFGFYGSVNLPLGPNCSRLIQVNRFFVQSIKAQEMKESRHGPMLYGFYKTPPLDIKINWSESHKTFVHSYHHKDWEFFLNTGANVIISYSVKSPCSVPLCLVIAQGSESLLQWIEDPSYPNTTLSWNIIQGNGIIHQEISVSNMYHIAVGNLNSEGVEVELNFTIKGFLYDTSQAYYKCSLNDSSCNLKLFLTWANAALLTSPGIAQGEPYDDWFIKLSYGPRWIAYFAVSGTMTAIILLAFRICNMFLLMRAERTGSQSGVMVSERAPLILRKEDDISSWSSSYESISHDEDELDEWLAVASLDGKLPKEGERDSSLRHLCATCFDAPRDCFFLPCGHSAFCFTCGTRIMEETGTCPICRRTIKKVRKIFAA